MVSKSLLNLLILYFFYILAQGKETAQHALSIRKLEKEIVILSKDIESFRNESAELRKRHQEDINRLETHVTENSKNIVGMFLFNLHRSGQTKDYAIGICCFSTKHAALRHKSKD